MSPSDLRAQHANGCSNYCVSGWTLTGMGHYRRNDPAKRGTGAIQYTFSPISCYVRLARQWGIILCSPRSIIRLAGIPEAEDNRTNHDMWSRHTSPREDGSLPARTPATVSRLSALLTLSPEPLAGTEDRLSESKTRFIR